MLIILPLSHEKGEVRRFPYITLGIIILNVLLYMVTFIVEPGTRKSALEAEKKLLQFYVSHRGLVIPEPIQKKLSPESKQLIQQMKKFENILGTENREIPVPTGDDEEETPVATGYDSSENQEKFKKLIREFDSALDNYFYRKYGYIPGVGGIFSLLSSIFLHGGFFHLFFNMLFLWLSGCNIEDLWGRIVYPIFYLLGGVIATLTHALMYPESQVPLVGASGAIAALMGAFLIRLYNIKIYFLYIFFFGFRIKRGFFNAPAYVMLPLWLLQQFWEVLGEWGMEGGGVAFWAHIGGFAFGALVALGIKLTKYEEKVLHPLIEKKTNLLDEYFSSGLEKLETGDIDGAVMDFRKAVLNNIEDPLARKLLSKAYFQQGNLKLALIEFNRSMKMFIDQERMDEAVDEYLEIQELDPNAALNDQVQALINPELKKRDIEITNKKSPEIPKQKDSENQTGKESQISTDHDAAQTAKPKSNKPIQKRIKVADNALKGIYPVRSLAPLDANKVLPVEGGIDLKRLSEKPMMFDHIFYLCVFELKQDSGNRIRTDIFCAGQSRPFRILNNLVDYSKFISNPDQNSFENFRKFILYIISQIESVYIDTGTYDFLKTRKVQSFKEQTDLEIHEKKIWGQLIGKARIVCRNCWEVYWIDEQKIPETGSKTKCKSCGELISVRRIEK